MDIFNRVRALNLPLGEYVIVGGVLEAHGIRLARDIDLVVSPTLFKYLRKNGWKRKWFFRGMFRRKALIKGDAEAFSNFKYRRYRPNTEDLINGAEIIKGLPFLPLIELMKFKKELGREKDLKDIELIHQFLNTKMGDNISL